MNAGQTVWRTGPNQFLSADIDGLRLVIQGPDHAGEPVRLHVNAKRYLTATDPGYFATLSPGSVRSLQLQGGPFTSELAAGFIALPYAQAAVRLRRWDEGGKVNGLKTPDLDHFRAHLEASLA